MRSALAPVGKRPIDVDADGVDRRRGPQRVEIKVHVAGAVGGLVAEVFGPVGAVDHFGGGEHALHIFSQRHQRRDERIARSALAHRGQPAQLRTDQERVDPAGGLGQIGMVQHHAPVRPGGRTRIVDGVAREREVAGVRGTDKAINLRRSRGRLVGATGYTRRRIARDASAPGKGRLSRAAVRIGQRIALSDIHEDERRQRHAETALLQIADGIDDALVRRRSAIGRASVALAHDVGRIARRSGHLPRLRARRLRRRLDARAQLAVARAQVGAEPAHDQRDVLRIGQRRLELIDRNRPVAAALARMHVLGRRAAEAVHARDRLRRVGELARARDHHDGADRVGECFHRAIDLEGELRQAVAECFEREPLEDDVRRAAISWCVAGAFARGNQAVGLLRLTARIDAVRDLRPVDLAPVRPDAADAADLAFGHGHGKIRVIAIGSGRGTAADEPFAAAARSRDDLLLEVGRPDHLAAEAGAAIDARDCGAFG
jgi:hypothetical protein